MSLFLERKFPPMSIKITIKITMWFKKNLSIHVPPQKE